MQKGGGLWELASLAFLERKENVLLLGPPGVGKTHLGIALGTEAIVAGYSFYFVTVQDLVQQFQRARDENKLKERLKLFCLLGWSRLSEHVSDGVRKMKKSPQDSGYLRLPGRAQ